MQKALHQPEGRSLSTDECLRVLGAPAERRIFALGDCATPARPRSLAAARSALANTALERMTQDELVDVIERTAETYPHLREFTAEPARVARAWKAVVGEDSSASADLQGCGAVLDAIDRSLRALPATAAVAKQEGEFLASLFADAAKQQQVAPAEWLSSEELDAWFAFQSKGSLAYIGGDEALVDIAGVGKLRGVGAGLAWKGFETLSQVSLRNQALVAFDWLRAKVFGRDMSRLMDV